MGIISKARSIFNNFAKEETKNIKKRNISKFNKLDEQEYKNLFQTGNDSLNKELELLGKNNLKAYNNNLDNFTASLGEQGITNTDARKKFHKEVNSYREALIEQSMSNGTNVNQDAINKRINAANLSVKQYSQDYSDNYNRTVKKLNKLSSKGVLDSDWDSAVNKVAGKDLKIGSSYRDVIAEKGTQKGDALKTAFSNTRAQSPIAGIVGRRQGNNAEAAIKQGYEFGPVGKKMVGGVALFGVANMLMSGGQQSNAQLYNNNGQYYSLGY